MDMERTTLTQRLWWLRNGCSDPQRCTKMLKQQATMPVLEYCYRDARLLNELAESLDTTLDVLFHIDYQTLIQILMNRVEKDPERKEMGMAVQLLTAPYLLANQRRGGRK